MEFASDNWAGAADPVVAAIAAEAGKVAPAYGNDAVTQRVEARFSELFEREVAVFPVATGSAANALALSAITKPGGVVICHREAHIATDECGGPEFFGGGLKLLGLEGPGGKITGQAVKAAAGRHGPEEQIHHGRPVAVSISQTTEFGGVYRAVEIAAIGDTARSAGLKLHMDGARFANAVAAQGVAPADLTWRAGVDVMSFGGTKNGAMAAEAVVFFDPKAASDFAFIRKRGGQLLSKSRFIAAQFDALLTDGRWLKLASHANAMAARLAKGIEQSKTSRLGLAVEANEVFAILPRAAAARAEKEGAHFYEWPTQSLAADQRPGADEALYRLVTSFRTEAAEVDRFVSFL